MRIIYDLLVRLQQDMVQEQHRHASSRQPRSPCRAGSAWRLNCKPTGMPFAAIWPNNRSTSRTIPRPTHGSSACALAQQWAAPRIMLPPQATPGDYLRLVCQCGPPAIRTPGKIPPWHGRWRISGSAGYAGTAVTHSPRTATGRSIHRAKRATKTCTTDRILGDRNVKAGLVTRFCEAGGFLSGQNPQPSIGHPAGGMPAYTGKTQKLTPDQLAWWQRSDGTTHANEAQRVTSKDDGT